MWTLCFMSPVSVLRALDVLSADVQLELSAVYRDMVSPYYSSSSSSSTFGVTHAVILTTRP